MNTIGIAVVWCALQVTLIGLLASGLYILLRRMRPAAAEPVVLTGLVMVILLSFLALSPWPRWTIGRYGDTAHASVASAEAPMEPPYDSVQKSSKAPANPRVEAKYEVASDPLAGGQKRTFPSSTASPHPRVPSGCLSQRERGGTADLSQRERGESRAAFWQILDEELSQPQGAESAKAWRWPAIVAMLIMVAMICGLAWLVLGVMAVRWQVHHSRPVLDGKLLEQVDVLRAKLGCRRPVDIRQCDDLVTAATVGWLRPVILLPADWQTWTADQCHAVLAHEIAHARSQDFLALLCGQFGLMLHFYHPLMHWLMNRLRLEQELAADAAAASVSGGQRQYLTTIAELALRKQERPLLWPARTFLPTKNTFLRRIAMLRDSKLRIDRLSPVARLISVGAVLLCGLLVAGLRGPGNSSSALAGDQTKITQDESKKTFEARLPSGITVELLGVAENPSKDKPWWRPDGSLLADRPYNSVIGDVSGDQHHVMREFAVLVRNMPSEPVGTKLEFDPTYDAAAGGNPKLLDPYKGELHTMAVNLPDQPTTTVRFAVADGPWETVIENQGSTAMGTTKGGFIFSRPVETQLPNSDARVILISVTHEIIGDETRLVAVDTDDREHAAISSTGAGAHNFKQITAQFSNLELKDIKVFRLQKRPYKSIEFRNVSLQPGQKTDVQIVWPDASAGSDDRQKILGNWEIVDFASGIKLLKNWGISEQEMQDQVSITKDSFLGLEYKLDPNKNPKTIDLYKNGKTIALGVYALQGDMLWTNFSTHTDRPTQLNIIPAEQSNEQMLILQRIYEEQLGVKPAGNEQAKQLRRLYPTAIDADVAGKKALEKYDTNKDGKISGAELEKAPALKAAMGTMHTNKDKGITADDIASRIKAWQATKVALIGGVTCTVIRNGKPVEGAEVEFVPEDFLGENVKTAYGTTGKDGFAMMSIPLGPMEPQGVAPGFYSVEITKPGEDIPAKYNSQTIYGLEIAPDVRMLKQPVFDISTDRATSDKEASRNNLKQIALAMHMYFDRQRQFPPAVFYPHPDQKAAPYSWRVALLHDLGYDDLFKQYKIDEPWDSPNNMKLLDKMPDVFRGPTDKEDSKNASYFALVGPDTMFEKNDTGRYKAGTRIQDIKDGTARTILLVEAKRDIPWTKPEDIDYDPEKPLPELGGYFEDGFCVSMADGSVHFLPKTISENVMRLLINKDDGQPVQLPPEER